MRIITWISAVAFWLAAASLGITATFHGEVVDAASGAPLPARVDVRNETGRWFGVRTAVEGGQAMVYGRTNWVNGDSVEVHTTLSAHPFARLAQKCRSSPVAPPPVAMASIQQRSERLSVPSVLRKAFNHGGHGCYHRGGSLDARRMFTWHNREMEVHRAHSLAR